jgi:nicastrin
LVAVTAVTAANEISPGSVALVSAEEAGELLQRCATDSKLQNNLAGVLIQQSLSGNFPGWNEAPAAPYPAYAVHEMDRDYPWNPAGLDLSSIQFPFPIYQLDNETSANALQRVEYNNRINGSGGSSSGGGGIGGASTAINVARMELTMEATGNSSTCIDSKTCYPLGGYSIWAALPPLPPPPMLSTDGEDTRPLEEQEKLNTLPTLLVIAQIDSTSLFHSLTQAADSPLSGLIAMLATAQVLGSTENSPLIVQKYQKRVVFLAVMGEPWDFMGSRRLLWELENGGLSVQGLEVESIEGIIELGQVGRLRRTTPISTNSSSSIASKISSKEYYQLFGHVEKTGVSGTAAAPLLAELQNLATESSTNFTYSSTSLNGVDLRSASAATPGLPPSSAASFLRQRPDIPVVVLQEFDSAFINTAYHSQYDTPVQNNDTLTTATTATTTRSTADVSSRTFQEEKFDQDGISATAIFLAHALNSLAQTNNVTNSSTSTSTSSTMSSLIINFTAVQETVDSLLDCLAKESPGMGCPLVTALMTPWNTGPAGHYIGILRSTTQSKS